MQGWWGIVKLYGGNKIAQVGGGLEGGSEDWVVLWRRWRGQG